MASRPSFAGLSPDELRLHQLLRPLQRRDRLFHAQARGAGRLASQLRAVRGQGLFDRSARQRGRKDHPQPVAERSEEHTSELQSLMRISYAVFCLKKKKKDNRNNNKLTNTNTKTAISYNTVCK